MLCSGLGTVRGRGRLQLGPPLSRGPMGGRGELRTHRHPNVYADGGSARENGPCHPISACEVGVPRRPGVQPGRASAPPQAEGTVAGRAEGVAGTRHQDSPITLHTCAPSCSWQSLCRSAQLNKPQDPRLLPRGSELWFEGRGAGGASSSRLQEPRLPARLSQGHLA